MRTTDGKEIVVYNGAVCATLPTTEFYQPALPTLLAPGSGKPSSQRLSFYGVLAGVDVAQTELISSNQERARIVSAGGVDGDRS